MAADDPKDAKKEFNRVKDNAGLEHRPKNVPDHNRAPRGHSGTEHSLGSAGPGGMSQPKREYKHKDPPQQTRDQKSQDADRSPNRSDAPQKKHFHKRELTRDFNERSR
jgi:hypothetical protein